MIINQGLYTFQCIYIHVLCSNHQTNLRNQFTPSINPNQIKLIQTNNSNKVNKIKIKRFVELPPILLLQRLDLP